MFDLQVEIGSTTTRVAVRPAALADIGSFLSSLREGAAGPVVLITDEQVGARYADRVLASLCGAGWTAFDFRIPPGEASKSIAQAEDIYRFLAAHQLGRDATVVALGGGVVSDLAGFVAGTWMRGVRFVICPTTLEANVDACLGGKTAVNLSAGKNLVGVFHQPAVIVIDPQCLRTLEDRDVRAGMAESVKHALIRSPDFLAWQEDRADAILSLGDDVIRELILRNLRIKGEIVQRDAREEVGVRILLNFGHTVGHAIEACSGYSLRHGECVALGMLAALRVSQRHSGLDGSLTDRVERLLLRFGLPTELREPIDPDKILDRMRVDKKVRGGSMRFVLLEDVAKPVVCADVSEALVREAYSSILG